MITYYVKKDEAYKVSATVDCVVYDSTGREIASCAAGAIMTFNAPAAKITLSDDNAVLKCLSEVTTDLSGLTEHVNNHGIHTTSNEKSRWNATTSDLVDVKDQIPDLESHVDNDVIHVTSAERQTWNGKANGTHNHAISDITNLQTTLTGKADSSHSHAASDITGLDTALANTKKYVDYSRLVTVSGAMKSITGETSDVLNYTAGDGDKCLNVHFRVAHHETYYRNATTGGKNYSGLSVTTTINGKTIAHFSQKVYVGSTRDFTLWLKKGDVVSISFTGDAYTVADILGTVHPWQ